MSRRRASPIRLVRPAVWSAVCLAFVAGYVLGYLTPPLTEDARRALPWLSPSSAPEVVSVKRVIDGDTLRVAWEGEEVSVRLLRINTPEKGQAGFEEATKALRQLVEGQTVRLEFERPGSAERDRYGRLLAYVFADDVHINVEIVRLGWSPFWTRYGAGRYAEAFREAERSARAAHRGLWSSDR